MPQSNRAFWRKNLTRNAARDLEQLSAIRKRGGRAMVVWECELKNELRLKARITRFLTRKRD
jgi:DNA mismatch endonuclease (patch repair protein)